jgi:hypothetical protein
VRQCIASPLNHDFDYAFNPFWDQYTKWLQWNDWRTYKYEADITIATAACKCEGCTGLEF